MSPNKATYKKHSMRKHTHTWLATRSAWMCMDVQRRVSFRIRPDIHLPLLRHARCCRLIGCLRFHQLTTFDQLVRASGACPSKTNNVEPSCWLEFVRKTTPHHKCDDRHKPQHAGETINQDSCFDSFFLFNVSIPTWLSHKYQMKILGGRTVRGRGVRRCIVCHDGRGVLVAQNGLSSVRFA